MDKFLESRLKQVYPSGVVWERAEDQLDQGDFQQRMQSVLDLLRRDNPLVMSLQGGRDPTVHLALTHRDSPAFDTWIWAMDNRAKIDWIESNASPYVVLWLTVSRVADYYDYYFNHWKPRGDTGYVDADHMQPPDKTWRGYAENLVCHLQAHGFTEATDAFNQQRVPFVLAQGWDEIPSDDPRWQDDDFEPPLVPAYLCDCLFGAD